MKSIFSSSLLIVWQVADLEARNLHAAFLEPGHLLLGLCKVVDLDLTALIPKELQNRDQVLDEALREFRRLRDVFFEARFDAMRFRRRYRTVLPEGSAGLNLNQGRLHRNDASKDIFLQAERLASSGRSGVFPIHLLHALLEERDETRDNTIVLLGVKPERLFQCVKHRLFFRDLSLGTSETGADPIRWN